MKRNASPPTSNAITGRSEREWRVHGQGTKHVTPNDGRFVYKDGKFGYRSSTGCIQAVFPAYGGAPTGCVAPGQFYTSINNCHAHTGAEYFDADFAAALSKRLTALTYRQCEHIRPVRQLPLTRLLFRPICIPFRPSSFTVPEQEQPDLTLADKEWIDKIDGHSLEVEDLY
jgi:hypothetical protein